MWMRRMACVAMAVVMMMTGVGFGAEAPSTLPMAGGDTIAVIRLKSIDQAVNAVTELVTAFDANAGAQMKMMAQMGLGQFIGVDLSKPMALLILDPKKHAEPVVGVFTLKDAAAFKIQGSQTVAVGTLGVICNDAEAMNAVAAMLKQRNLKAVPTADMQDMLVANVNIKEIMTRYKADIEGGLAMAKMQLGGGMQGDDAPPADPKMQMASKGLDYLGKLLAEMEKQGGPMEMGLNISKNEITARLMTEAAAGSDFAGFLAKNAKPMQAGLANFLPKGATMTSIGWNDPESMGNLTLGLVEIAADILGLEKEETARNRTVLADTLKNTTGLQASATLAVGDGQAGITLAGIKDSDAARKNTAAMLQLANTGVIGEFLKKYGVAVKLTEKQREYQGIPIDRIEVLLDFDAMAKELELGAQEQAQMKEALGKMLKSTYGREDGITMEMTYGKSLAVVAYGPELEKVMNAQIELMKADGVGSIAQTPEYKAALARHPKEASMFWHLSPFAYAETMGKMMASQMGPQMGGMNIFPTRAELPANEDPISGSMLVNGNKATMRMHVPVKPLVAIGNVVRKKLEAMMGDMMQPQQVE